MTSFLRSALATCLAAVAVFNLQILAGEQPAPKADGVLKITDADNGKTVKAKLGQEIHVSLKGDRAKTGWETSRAEGAAVQPVKVGGTHGKSKVPPVEFTPAEKGGEDIGTYMFRYKAVAEGTTKLRYVYVYPGGSKPTARTATQLVREFNVTIEVAKPAAK